MSFSSLPEKIDLSAPVTLQKARSWDEGVADKFSTSSMADVFKGKKVVIFGVPAAFTGICQNASVPSYVKAAREFKAKGADAIICTAVNDPYTLNAWAEKIGAKGQIDFYADFDGKFHEMLGLQADCAGALLGMRSQRWAAVVEDGSIKAIRVENSTADFHETAAHKILPLL
eukprot:TRINITY_DN1496_c0_g1_i2.p1 TRINITY_DN1496_c0_g1~~TRINITY_DN1496_c0_g1_i2.p1  ORF type:complete len:172 (-),score=60.96 TRINITY_DN1496_c0_g1_i2:148-663(-)